MQIFQVLIARVWANKWRPCGAEMTIKPYKESVTWWKWKCINISREILRMNECNHYIMEYMCQTIYCVYRVLFALPVVAVHNIYRYILKTDKWVMASCAYQHHFRGFQNWPTKHSQTWSLKIWAGIRALGLIDFVLQTFDTQVVLVACLVY